MGSWLDCVARGWRFGLRMGNVLASVILAAFALTVCTMLTDDAHHHYGVLVGDFSLAVLLFLVGGVLPGLVLGLVLGLAPERLTRRWAARSLLTLLCSGAVVFGEICLALAIWRSGVPVVTFLPMSVVIAAVTVAFSRDIAGHSMRHAWLWSGPNPVLAIFGVPLTRRRPHLPR